MQCNKQKFLVLSNMVSRKRSLHKACKYCGGFIMFVSVVCMLFGNVAVEILYTGIHEMRRSLPTQCPQRDSDTCTLKWDNSRINLTAYEEDKHSIEELRNLITTKPRKGHSIYRKSTITLDPDRFILPVLINGPNNQISGLRESVFVAIKLNRTLVLPKFFKHFSDSTSVIHHQHFVFPGHRLNIEDLCTFITCVTFGEFREACGYSIDGIINLSPSYSRQDLRHFMRHTGMEIANTPFDAPDIESVNFIPRKSVPHSEYFRKFQPTEIEDLFHSDARCVLYPRPLFNLKINFRKKERRGRLKRFIEKQEDIPDFPDSILMRTIMKRSLTPLYIINIAKDFIRDILNNRQFLSVHWRYNKDDFMRRCKGEKGKKSVVKMRLCANAMLVKPSDIAESIENKIFALKNLTSVDIRDIYIASPTSERNVVDTVNEILRNRHGWRTSSSVDLHPYMKKVYSTCNIMQKHFDDILSTTEMEICAQSVIFLGSAKSSWTANVQVSRASSTGDYIRSEFDAYVLDIFH